MAPAARARGATSLGEEIANSVSHGIGMAQPGAKHLFKILDHCGIYLLIAGTYTPFTLATLRGDHPPGRLVACRLRVGRDRAAPSPRASSASFSARVIALTAASRRSAAPRFRHGISRTSVTGSRDRV